MGPAGSAFVRVRPGSYVPGAHFYPVVHGAQLHPTVGELFSLGNERIASRYCRRYPACEPEAIRRLLATVPEQFRWAGADLFNVRDDDGGRHLVLVETNSCPSGLKSMPPSPGHPQGGYRTLLERSFVPLLERHSLPRGCIAVIWDKNWMEASGLAAVMADVTGEEVLLVEAQPGDDAVRCIRGVVHVRAPDGFVPVRAGIRRLTQRSWTRVPPVTRTALLNPVLCALAGAQNKALAANAYRELNARLRGSGLEIRSPYTVTGVLRRDVPRHVEQMGGVAVVKYPYGNGGIGVYTIARPADLDAFMAAELRCERVIVQALVGGAGWSSVTGAGRLSHVGTAASPGEPAFVTDLRFQVGAGPTGFYPLAMFARRARAPLAAHLDDTAASTWDMLGTNLTVVRDDGTFDTDPTRLVLVDDRSFDRLGLDLDDLCEAYVLTVMATLAIDGMCRRLLTRRGRFRRRRFTALNGDASLSREILDDAGASGARSPSLTRGATPPRAP